MSIKLCQCKLFATNALLLLVAVLAGCNDQMAAESSRPSPVGQLASKIVNDLPSDFIADSNTVFSRTDNQIALLAAGAASIAMNQHADNEIADHFEDHEVFSHCPDTVLDIAGNPGVHFAATGIWYVLAAEYDNPLEMEKAWTMMRALSVNGFFTLALKLARDNETPNGKPLAWPSGHTSSSFTVASVLDEYYGPAVGIPAYIAAGAVGVRMMDQEDHWGSDVVFGAVLGWVVGHTVAGEHDFDVAGFNLIPLQYAVSGETAAGIALHRRF